MQWIDQLVASLDSAKAQIINDSKTPSGRVHVGALRGVLIHDAVYRELRGRGFGAAGGGDATYMFGVDDYDPLDELPAGQQEYFAPYLGRPLCEVPPPPGSPASDLAEHYIAEFFHVFDELGVETSRYRMRDVYRSGRFNDAIRTILSHADVVRRVYKEVSNSDRPPDWYPFQVVCERCGRIGTTQVYAFDGDVVRYRCRPDLVTWARGCGHEGAISPFDGRGKLPWKLEWVAKWHTFGITIEGAGKDHTTRGGSRDVAAGCLRAIFDKEAPKNIPYEFFLVGGAKMSSSRGVGASARDIANLLPPEVLRFLILKTPPNRPVNFSPEEQQIVKLFNEYDRLRAKAAAGDAAEPEQRLLRLCQVRASDPLPAYEPPFQILATLLQMPHLDVAEEVTRRKGSPLDDVERAHLSRRIAAGRYWLDHYASDDEKFSIQATAPQAIRDLSSVQRVYLHRLGEALAAAPWTDEDLQSIIFDTARLTPLASADAFVALYVAFLDRRAGPRAGSLLSFLDRAFVLGRLAEVPYSLNDFWRDSAEPLEALERWLAEKPTGVQIERLHFELLTSGAEADDSRVIGIGVVECGYAKDEKKMVRRALFATIDASRSTPAIETSKFEAAARDYVDQLSASRDLGAITVSYSSHHEPARAAIR